MVGDHKSHHPACYAGIDPGAKGALVLLTGSGRVIAGLRFDRVGGLDEAVAALRPGPACDGGIRLAIEKVSNAPGEGGSSAFAFGRAVGFWDGVARALAIPSQEVAPAVWQRVVLGSTPPSAGHGLAGRSVREAAEEARAAGLGEPEIAEAKRAAGRASAQARAARKAWIAEHASRLFPGVPIKSKADWPMLEAACIAEWGRRQFSKPEATP